VKSEFCQVSTSPPLRHNGCAPTLPIAFAQAPLASRSGSGHRAFLFYRTILPRFPCASFRHRAENAAPLHDRPVSARRSGAGLTFVALFQSLPHFGLPYARRCARRTRVAWTAARPPSCRVPGCNPATGLVMTATSMARCSSALSRLRHRARKIATTFPVARFALPVFTTKKGWSASSRERSWHPAHPTKKATLRWPRRGHFHSRAGASFHIQRA